MSGSIQTIRNTPVLLYVPEVGKGRTVLASLPMPYILKHVLADFKQKKK